MSQPSPLLLLNYGSAVCYQGRRCIIRQESQDMVSVVIYDPESGALINAPIETLSPLSDAPALPEQDISTIPDEAWSEAQRKYQIIEPLLTLPRRSRVAVKAQAELHGVGCSTIYRWLQEFDRIGKVSVFLRQSRQDKGNTTLSPEVEKIVSDTIEARFLTRQRWSAAKVHREIDKLCARAKLATPHINTVRNRLKKIDRFKKTKAREGSKAAEAEGLLIQGHFPGADVPLAVVQIDHTPVDLILVDNIHRLAIGRPWLTLLIDVFSRMILGFYISFDPPGNLSLGLCLVHSILPKEKGLTKLGIDTAWPCWGLPRTIHADNAREFRGKMLQKACQEYSINMEWRPVAKPRYGAHIERLLGTLNEEIHGLAGTTFSNTSQRGDYDSDGQASMSLEEFERWFTHLCVDIYHQRPHSQLGMPPIAKWQEGILGTRKKPGIGMPARITNELKLKLDLMPFETRTVQHYGIIWDRIEYQSDILRRWVNETDPEHPKLKRKFLCRRDPRDISCIWFYDPEVQQYFAIPYRNTSHPAISIWGLREAEKRAKEEQPKVAVDENLIFAAYDQMQMIEANAKKLTRKVRRNQERKRVGFTNARDHLPAQASSEKLPPPPPKRLPSHIQPFDDVDDLQDE